MQAARHLRIIILLCFFAFPSFGQESQEAVLHAEEYITERSDRLLNSLNHSEKIQNRLLRRLARKENRLLKKLAAKDSALYFQYKSRSLSYDSIARLARDSSYLKKTTLRKDRLLDTLKGVQQYIQSQAGKVGSLQKLSQQGGLDIPFGEELQNLQQKVSAQQNIDQLISQKTNSLQQMFPGQGKALKGIQQQVYYAQEKIKAWKKAAEEPEEAEEELMEYLQGIEGFGNYLNPHQNAYGGLGNNASAQELEAMGYQLKSTVNRQLAEKLGGNLASVQQNVAGQVQEYTEQLGDAGSKINEARDYVKDAQQTIAAAKEVKDKVRQESQSAFRKNPERGKPFKDRVEFNYNFQATRSSIGGLTPAMMDIGLNIAFKHSPRLSYGLGANTNIGLGKNWQQFKLTYEGIGLRAFVDYKLIFGFSVQGGYEQVFRPLNRPYLSDSVATPAGGEPNPFQEAFGGRQRTAYLGIMKRYKINKKWSGTFLAGYNFLWQQEGMRSPWLLRVGWAK